jgi:LPXTG-site transpeptidase (sortase) family protein
MPIDEETRSPRRAGRLIAFGGLVLLLGGAVALRLGPLRDAPSNDRAGQGMAGSRKAGVDTESLPLKAERLAHPNQLLKGPLPEAPEALPGSLRVAIPQIGVNAPMLKLGLNGDGSLQVPADIRVTGWWAGGPFPGDRGPAVVVGHVDSRGGPGVFYRLKSLRRGDSVFVSRPDGKVAAFVVDSMTVVSKDDFPTSRVYGPVGRAELRLITCGGPFDSSTGHYVDNIIVFAHLTALSFT